MQVKTLLECNCLKMWDLLSLICFLILVSEWYHPLSIQMELQLAQVKLYTIKDFKSLRIGPSYEEEFLVWVK